MSDYPRTPMRSYEKLAVEYLLGLSQEAEGALQVLEKRLETVDRREKLCAITKDITDVVSEVLLTVPEKQLIALRANLGNMEMQLKIKKATSELEPQGATYVHTGLLTDVLKEYSMDKCRLCLGGAEEQRNCRYKELMDEVIIEHVPEKPYCCKYRDAEWAE